MIAMVRPLTAALMIGFTALMVVAVLGYEFWKESR